MPPFALPTGSFVGAGRDSVASLKAVVTQILGLDQVVLSFEAPVSVGIAPGQAVSCDGASRTAAKFCGGRNSVYSLLVVLAGRRMREWLDVVNLLSGARDASQLVAQKVYLNLGGGVSLSLVVSLFQAASRSLPYLRSMMAAFIWSRVSHSHSFMVVLMPLRLDLRLLRSYLLSPRSRPVSTNFCTER